MTTLNVSLPDAMKAFIESQVQTGFALWQGTRDWGRIRWWGP